MGPKRYLVIYVFLVVIAYLFFFGDFIFKGLTLLFEEIPFIMLYHDSGEGADRINIVGALWLVGFTVFLALFRFKPLDVLKDFLRNSLKAGIFILFAHHIIDGLLLTSIYVFFKIGGYSFNAGFGRISTAFVTIIFVLMYVYFFNGPLNHSMTFSKKTVVLFLISCVIIFFFGFFNLGDFSFYQGYARIWRFWLVYPIFYCLVSLFCLSLIKKEKVTLNTKQYYLKGEKYDWTRDPRLLEKKFHDAREKETVNALKSFSLNSNVLDVGCGTGLITRHFNGNVLALDINRWNLNRGKKHSPNANFVVGDCDFLPLKANSIDFIVCTETFEHLTKPKLVLSEIQRVTKNSGKMLISVPSNSFIWRFRCFLTSTHRGKEPFHRNYSETDLTGLLKRFQIVKIRKIAYGLTWLVVCRCRALENDKTKRILFSDVFNLYNHGERLSVETIVKSLSFSKYGYLSFYSIVDRVFLKNRNIELIGFPNYRFILVCLPTFFFKAWLYHKTKNQHFLNSFLKNIRSFDLAVDLGGETFQDHYNFFGLLKHIFTLNLLCLLRVKYAVVSHSILFKHGFAWKLSKPFLQKAKAVSVRDFGSFRFLKSNGVKCRLIPDIVFANCNFNKFKKIRVGTKFVVGVNASPYVRQYIDHYVGLIETLVRFGFCVNLIPHVLSNDKRDDRIVLLEIWHKLKKETKKNVTVYFGDNFDVIKKMIAESNVWVGSRFHSCVYALSRGIPTVIVGYSPKADKLKHILRNNIGLVHANSQTFTEDIMTEINIRVVCYEKHVKNLRCELKKIKKESMNHVEMLRSLF